MAVRHCGLCQVNPIADAKVGCLRHVSLELLNPIGSELWDPKSTSSNFSLRGLSSHAPRLYELWGFGRDLLPGWWLSLEELTTAPPTKNMIYALLDQNRPVGR